MSVAQKVFSNRTKTSPATQVVLFTGAAAILSLLISPLTGGLSTHGLAAVWPVALLMVVAQATGNILYFKGLAELEASVASVAFSSILLWGIILSVLFLDSSFSLKQTLGIVLLFLAILTVQYRRGVKKVEPAILYVVGSALLFAVFQVSSAELAKTIPAATYLLLNYAGATALVWLVYRKQVHRDVQGLKSLRVSIFQSVIVAAATSTGYFVFSYFAYKHAPDRGVVVVLLTAQVVLSVIFGIIFLKERKQMIRKLSAGFLALTAGVLIKS